MGIFSSGKGKFTNLDAETFEAKIAEDNEAVLIDVRTYAEYADARIPNSLLIDIYSGEFISKIDALDRAKSYYVYCRSGSRSRSAAVEMNKMGFEKVYNLDDGIICWNGKIEKGEI